MTTAPTNSYSFFIAGRALKPRRTITFGILMRCLMTMNVTRFKLFFLLRTWTSVVNYNRTSLLHCRHFFLFFRDFGQRKSQQCLILFSLFFFVWASCSFNTWFLLFRVFPPRGKREPDLVTAWIKLILFWVIAIIVALRLQRCLSGWPTFAVRIGNNDYNTEYELILYAWKRPLWWIIISTY